MAWPLWPPCQPVPGLFGSRPVQLGRLQRHWRWLRGAARSRHCVAARQDGRWAKAPTTSQ